MKLYETKWTNRPGTNQDTRMDHRRIPFGEASIGTQRSMTMSSSSMGVVVLGDPADPSIEPVRSLDEVRSIGTDVTQFSQESLQSSDVLYVVQTSALGPGAASAAVEAMLLAMPNLRWIHSQSAGVNHLIGGKLMESPVVLTNARGVYSRSLAEYCLLAMLYFCKDVPRLRNQQKQKLWNPFVIEELHGKTVGVVGYGDIGKTSAAMAKRACSVRVLALRRNPAKSVDDGIADKVFGQDQLKDMVKECDFVICAAPDTPETRGMINAEVIASMRSDAVIINVGRGTVIEEKALCDALSRGAIRGAALDVVESEPLPEPSPLYELDNVLLSPHNADQTATFKLDSTKFFLEMLKEYRQDQPLRNVVDKSAGY